MFIFFITSAISSLLNASLMPLVYSIFFNITIFSIFQNEDDSSIRMVEWATSLFLVFIILSIIGVLYHLMGGHSLFSLVNADGRDNNFYLSTFSNSETFTIRPSAIYDEPGAFSFYICTLVIMRSRLRMPCQISAILLIGGMITQSITHVLFTLVWFFWAIKNCGSNNLNLKNKMFQYKYFFLIISLSIIYIVYLSGILDWTFERAIQFYNEPLTNPRYRSMKSIIDFLESNPWSILYGFDANCVQRLDTCGDFGENPLTPLIYGGLLVSWPYYLVLIFSSLSFLKSKDWLLLIGANILLFQRPYLLEFPYSGLFILCYIVWFIPNKFHEKNFKNKFK